jgi:hypothetical protein
MPFRFSINCRMAGLAIGCVSSPVGDHMGMGDWPVFVSEDRGATWSPSDDPTLPPN